MTNGVLEDLALLTHSNYSLAELGFSNSGVSENIFFVRDLGQAKKVVIKKEKSIFFISKFAKLITNRRINELTREIILSDSEYEKSLLKTRIARLSGKITKIKLGISNQYEITEIKQKVEAIIKTIKSALESGFLAGGGSFSFFIRDEILNWSYLNLIGDEIFAGKIVYDSLVKPFEKLIENNSTNLDQNSKLSFYKISEELKLLGYPYGYNVLTNKIVNTFTEGLIDSSKSIRASLWNSLTLISLLITTE